MLGSDPTGRGRSDWDVQHEEPEVLLQLLETGQQKHAQCPNSGGEFLLRCWDTVAAPRKECRLPQQEPGCGCCDKEQAGSASASPLQHQHLTGLHK